MDKTIFKNKLFFYLLISYLIFLVVWNSYALILGNLVGGLSVLIQAILLLLIFNKHKYAKLGIKLWSTILIIGFSLSIFGKLIKIFLGDEIIIPVLMEKIIFLIFGILIYTANEKYVEIKSE